MCTDDFTLNKADDFSMKFDKLDFSLPLFCKAVRYQISKNLISCFIFSPQVFFTKSLVSCVLKMSTIPK